MDYIDLFFKDNKDEEWYRDVLDLYVPFNQVGNNDEYYEKLKSLYGLVNNDLKALEDYMKLVKDPTGGVFSIPIENMLDNIDLLHNPLFSKIQHHINNARLIPKNISVLPVGEDSSEFKQEEYLSEVTDFVDRMMQEINQAIQQGKQDQLDAILQKKPESYENFNSSIESFYSDLIEYVYNTLPIDSYIKTLIIHLLTSDTAYIGVVEEAGKPKMKVFNTLQSRGIGSPNELEIDKLSYFFTTESVSIHDAYREVLNYGNEEDLEKLSQYSSYHFHSRPNESWDITSAKAKPDYNFTAYKALRNADQRPLDKDIGHSTEPTRNTTHEEFVWRTHLIFNAYDKIKILNYYNENNKFISEIVTDFIVPKDATKVKKDNEFGKEIKVWQWVDEAGQEAYLEERTIPVFYEAVRYESDIIIKYRKLPYQSFNINKEYSFPIKRKVLNSMNAKNFSLIERACPTLAQIIYVKKLQNRELSKYKGNQQVIDHAKIPDWLVNDENGNSLFKNGSGDNTDKLLVYKYIQDVFGYSLGDDGADNLGVQGLSTSRPASEFIPTTAFAEIINMQNYLSLLDRELGMIMLVPPQSDGTFNPYSTAKQDEQAMQVGNILAHDYYAAVSDLINAGIQEYLHQLVNYFRKEFRENPERKEITLNYIVGSSERKLLKIIPEYLHYDDLGFYMANDNYVREYKELMTQYGLQPLSQNRGEGAELMSLIFKAIVKGDDPETIHKMITIKGKEQEEQLMRMQQAQSEAAKALQESEQAGKERLATIKGEYDVQKATIASYAFQDDQNKDQDGIPDQIEALEAVRKIQQEDRKLSQKDRELDIKQQAVQNSKNN